MTPGWRRGGGTGLPILHVKDPSQERRFYEHLGLRATYEGPGTPDFIAVGNDAVEFGPLGALRAIGAGLCRSGATVVQ
jgi:hypothetical protein